MPNTLGNNDRILRFYVLAQPKIKSDHKTGYVVWVGAATADVQKNPSDQPVKARLDYAVTQLLERVPK